ncbi:MAG: YigZ family protein [bacterium]|nr:YigZ family protein [bacterium]
MNDSYFSVAKEARAETKVKGSRFIGRVWPIESQEAALELLAQVRRDEYAATHNCYAYRVGLGPHALFKYSDDGEPSGTAGKPIYDILEGRDLTNTIVVVTRYYGGTKLGTGGLVRAYSEAAALALDEAGLKEHYLSDQIKIEILPGLYNQFMQMTQHFLILDQQAEFSDRVIIQLRVRKSQTKKLIESIVELSSGKAVIEKQVENEPED